MKKTIISIAIMLALTGTALALDASSWNVLKGDHFIVYYKNAPREYVSRVISRAESYYNSINDELGFSRFDNFWTWDKRASVYIFDNSAEYQNATRQPGWSAAKVDMKSRCIYTFAGMNDFFEATLPHEIGHIIFYEFIGSDKAVPLWLLEGVACSLEKSGKENRLQLARKYAKTGELIPLDRLSSITGLHASINPDVFYSESAAIVGFFISRYGKDKFVDFCRRLRDMRSGERWDAVLRDTYGFKNLSELSTAYLGYMSK